MTETEKAYLAGFIDGEGSIGVYPDYRHSHNYRLVMSISNTNKEVMDWVAAITGELNSRQTKIKTTADSPSWQKMRWKDVYSVWLGGGATKRILKEVFPYLIVKKEHAQIAIKYPMGLYGKHITEEQRIQKDWCYEQLKSINQVGPNKRGPKREKGGDLGYGTVE